MLAAIEPIELCRSSQGGTNGSCDNTLNSPGSRKIILTGDTGHERAYGEELIAAIRMHSP